jgi:hypothetical protein
MLFRTRKTVSGYFYNPSYSGQSQSSPFVYHAVETTGAEHISDEDLSNVKEYIVSGKKNAAVTFRYSDLQKGYNITMCDLIANDLKQGWELDKCKSTLSTTVDTGLPRNEVVYTIYENCFLKKSDKKPSKQKQ